MKLNFEWNNTDWSVSKLKSNKKTERPIHKPMTAISPHRPAPVRNVLRLPTPQQPPDSLAAVLERARHEAIALAWSTNFPLLVLPCLKEELEHRAADYFGRQNRVRADSQEALRAAFPVSTSLAA